MTTKFYIRNPNILGSFPKYFEADTPEIAAKMFWDTLTGNQYVTNNLPRFLFTMQENENGPLYHFMLKEIPKDNKHADYIIESISSSDVADDTTMQKFLQESKNINKLVPAQGQTGGQKNRRRYLDNDDDSPFDYDDDYLDYLKLNRTVRPITYWWYAPTIYRSPVIFTPTFNTPIAPYVQLYLF
jgi:hypothetical protein